MISVLVPIYNAEPFLKECLDSIINQTYSNIQIVLINDGSKDRSLDICNEYREKDSRIEVYSRDNKGVAFTRNELLKHINGEFFLFVDADDWLEKDMLEYLLYIITSHDADIAVCSTYNDNITKDSNRKEPKINTWNRYEAIEKFLYHKTFNGSLWNKLIKTNLIQDTLFDPGISYGEDALFIWNILKKINKLVISDSPLYHYRMNPCSLSHGNFGLKKLTANKVWESICIDVDHLYPKFAYISHARWGMELTQLLLGAAKNNYPPDEDIKTLKNLIRKKHKMMNQAKITSTKGLIFSWLISRNYSMFRYLLK